MSHRESLEGNVYLHTYFGAKFEIIAEQDGDYVCAWLDKNQNGFRFSKHKAPSSEWELLEENNDT